MKNLTSVCTFVRYIRGVYTPKTNMEVLFEPNQGPKVAFRFLQFILKIFAQIPKKSAHSRYLNILTTKTSSVLQPFRKYRKCLRSES